MIQVLLSIILLVLLVVILILIFKYLNKRNKSLKEKRVIIKSIPLIIDMLSEINLSKVVEEANDDYFNIKNEIKNYLQVKSELNLKKIAEKIEIKKGVDNIQTYVLINILNKLTPKELAKDTFSFNCGNFMNPFDFNILFDKYTLLREYLTLFSVDSKHKKNYNRYVLAAPTSCSATLSNLGEIISLNNFILNLSHILNSSYGHEGFVFTKYLFIFFFSPMSLGNYKKFLSNGFMAYYHEFKLKFVGNCDFNPEKFEVLNERTGFDSPKYSGICFIILENLNYVEEDGKLILVKTDQ